MDSDSLEKIVHDNLIRFGKMITKGSILIEGIINAVDEDVFTVDVTIQSSNPDGSITNTIVYNVPIKVLQGSQASFMEIPQVGTNCTICFRDNNIQRPQLSQVDQCDKILIKIGDNTLQVDSTAWVFNGGTHGMVKADSLISKINTIENTLNTFMNTTFNTHTHAVPSLGTSDVPIPLNTATITPTVETDISNDKIKQ